MQLPHGIAVRKFNTYCSFFADKSWIVPHCRGVELIAKNGGPHPILSSI